MKNILFIIILSISSCAAPYKKHYSGEDLISKSSTESSQVNQLPNFKNLIIPEKHANRMPAAVAKKSSRPLKNLSNKRVYFLTVLNQYLEFGKYMDRPVPPIQTCSHFHSTHLDYHAKKNKSNGNPWNDTYLIKSSSEVISNKFPELFLSLDHNSSTPTVADYISKTKASERSELIYKAFKIHVEKTYMELVSLCETGVSTNYYIFENFITHVKNHPDFKNNDKALKSLLKLTVFSNILLKSTIQAMAAAKSLSEENLYSTFEQEIIARLGADWSKTYWTQLKAKRYDLETNKPAKTAKFSN